MKKRKTGLMTLGSSEGIGLEWTASNCELSFGGHVCRDADRSIEGYLIFPVIHFFSSLGLSLTEK